MKYVNGRCDLCSFPSMNCGIAKILIEPDGDEYMFICDSCLERIKEALEGE